MFALCERFADGLFLQGALDFGVHLLAVATIGPCGKDLEKWRNVTLLCVPRDSSWSEQ